MLNKPRVIGFIPAKGESLRLKNKNMRIINGHPLIAWTIHEALKSKFITQLVVSSDNQKILNISKKYGCRHLHLRKKRLTRTNITNYEVILEYLNENNLSDKFDIIMLLQPTSPIRDFKHIDNGITGMINNNLYTIASVFGPILKRRDPSLKMISDSYMSDLFKTDYFKKNIPYFILNGSIYGSTLKYFVKNKTMYSKKQYPIIMNNIYSIDVNDEEDFLLAEYYLKRLKKKINF